MVERIAIVSGKGGVSKTTTAINLAYAIKNFHYDVTLIDANFFTPDLGVFLGVSRTPVCLQDVLLQKRKIVQAVYMHKSGVKIVPSSISNIALRDDHIERLGEVLYGLDGLTEYIILDCPPGLSKDAISTIKAANSVLIVVNANLASVTDALKTIKVSESLGKKVLGVIVSRLNKDGSELKLKNVETMLGYPILGVIPEDPKVRFSLSNKEILTQTAPKSAVAVEYKKIAAKLLDETYKEKPQEEKFSYKLLKTFGLKR